MDSKFSHVKKGYSIQEVDSYINTLESELKIFKDSQSAISQAIVHAENKAQQIIEDAHIEAKNIQENSNHQLDQLKKKIKYMRMKLDSFQSNYNQLIHKYIISMNNEDFHNLYSSLDKLSDTLDIQTQRNIKTTEISDDNISQENIINFQYEKITADY